MQISCQVGKKWEGYEELQIQIRSYKYVKLGRKMAEDCIITAGIGQWAEPDLVSLRFQRHKLTQNWLKNLLKTFF